MVAAWFIMIWLPDIGKSKSWNPPRLLAWNSRGTHPPQNDAICNHDQIYWKLCCVGQKSSRCDSWSRIQGFPVAWPKWFLGPSFQSTKQEKSYEYRIAGQTSVHRCLFWMPPNRSGREIHQIEDQKSLHHPMNSLGFLIRFHTHRIHVWYIWTYIYHKNQPFMWKLWTHTMDPKKVCQKADLRNRPRAWSANKHGKAFPQYRSPELRAKLPPASW